MPMFVPDYDQLFIHKEMLGDRMRVEAYIAAIDRVVTGDSVVIDIGAGTGVLSLAAARAGARRVYAFERAKILELAKRNFAANFPDGRIEAVAGDSRGYAAGQGFADVLVSEWLGVHVFQENMLACLLDARDRFLRPNAIMIPARVGLWLAPLHTNPRRQREIDAWMSPFMGFDFTALGRLSLDDPYNFTVEPSCLAAAGQEVLRLDMSTLTSLPLYAMRGSFALPAAANVEAICGWFAADLAPGVCLDTSPLMPRTHWHQAIYPFAQPIGVAAGDTLILEVDAEPREGYCEFTWRGHVAGREAATARQQSTWNNYLIGR
jgi:SAM-dependent methyltransferase